MTYYNSQFIITYNQSSENELTIVIRHYYCSLRFITVSISLIFNFIYCYGFDFDRICSIKVQRLIRFYFILIEIKIKFQYYVCRIFNLLEFEYTLLFYFIILEGKFFFSKDNGAFSPSTPLMMDFSWFFDNLITHEHDLSFGLQSSSDIHIPALNFCHLAGGTVPSSGWLLARYRPRHHLATDYALRWRG